MRVQYTRCCYCFVEIFKDWCTRGQSNHNQGRNSQSHGQGLENQGQREMSLRPRTGRLIVCLKLITVNYI